ncbi:Uncharacterized protein dnm_084680 [Desulfonema magnum]|uniref:Uncharacterized protein n=1 Tax=Desulfonema magnum TaxID=45655 RepID=A0A975BVA8_9BACT|nr:Uncharacterized protein dnm_084680 [Desulfonema magnum]
MIPNGPVVFVAGLFFSEDDVASFIEAEKQFTLFSTCTTIL